MAPLKSTVFESPVDATNTPALLLVIVTLSVTEARDRATVTVADTGEGMAPAEVAKMFDRFYKGAESRGSGLGLAIAKSIVTAHHGEISAVS